MSKSERRKKGGKKKLKVKFFGYKKIVLKVNEKKNEKFVVDVNEK